MRSLTKCILCEGWWEGETHPCPTMRKPLTELRVVEIVNEQISEANQVRVLACSNLVPFAIGRDETVLVDKRVADLVVMLRMENGSFLATRGTSRPFADDIAAQARDAAIEECAVRIEQMQKPGESLWLSPGKLAEEIRRMKGRK